MRAHSLLPALLVTVASALLALGATWPLPRLLSTHIPGSNVDEGAFLWNLWWVRFALLDLRQSPLWTDYIFYPVGVNLATYTLTLLNGLLAIPIERVAGPIMAANLLFLGSLILSALGSYWLVRTVLTEHEPPSLERELASFVGGLVAAFPTARFVYAALGQMNFASTTWLPFFLVGLLRLCRGARAGRLPILAATGAGLSFAAAALTELTYAVFLVLFAVPLLVGEAAWWWQKRVLPGRLLLGLALLAATATLPLLSLVPAYLVDRELAQAGLGEAARFSADLLSFVVPSRLHPLLGGMAREWSAEFRDLPIAFLGWVTLALAGLGAVACWRAARVWVGAAALFALLALGPLLTINGQDRFDLDGLVVSVPLPFLLLHYLPLVGANRVPNRFSLVLMLALAVLVGLGLAWLLRHLPRRAILVGALLAGGLVFAEHRVALPLRSATPPAGYHQLHAEAGDFAILQLPLGWRNSYGTLGREWTIVQAFQWAHEKRLFGGNTSRNPPIAFTYFQRVPLFHSIIQLEEGKPLRPNALAEDQAGVPYLVALFDLRYLVVYRPLTPPGVEEYTRAVLGAELVEEGELTIYRVPRLPPPRRVDLGTPASAGALGSGWGEDEVGAGGVSLVWATARQAELFLPAPGGAATIRLRITPLLYPEMPSQRLRLRLNGYDLGEQVLPPDWSELSVVAPASAWRSGANRLVLEFAHLASPQAVLGTPDPRQLAAALDWVEVEPLP
ncbi:MAG: hypothetical protein KatS3mg061_0198 [Dehalococcoidia bacterium]|nr:MAG: hypothetical protein KatS3mg061_0198 [Dehalococcoidia bacterium]